MTEKLASTKSTGGGGFTFADKVAGWFLIIKQIANVVGSFKDDDWYRHGLGALFTEALAACWRVSQTEIGSDADLRDAFLKILTALTARQVPEALHLRSKVSEVMATALKV